MIPSFNGKIPTRTLSGGFAPLAAWQTTPVFLMVNSRSLKR